MRQNLIKSFWTVFQIYGESKRMLKFFTMKLLISKYVNMFKHMEISETIYDGVV